MDGLSGALTPSSVSEGRSITASRASAILERFLPALLIGISVWAVLAGQLSIDLLTMDDLREAEVAREILETGDHVIPHLAGWPFLEKPPGFSILLSLAYRAVGGPSAAAAHLVTAAFALLSLAAVYFLGRKAAGPRAGALACVVLATAACFCRTAHTVLLDNALTASVAWAQAFGWMALDQENIPIKRRWYAAAAFCAGLSFLFKGFVGPALAVAGFLVLVGILGRWKELRHALHPVAVAAFLAPVLSWGIPFCLRASRDNLYEFFVLNHFGRAFSSYEGHPRPFYFYLMTVWAKFAPGSVLLPFAAWAAWKGRARRENGAATYLFFTVAGGFLLLSLSRTKDDVYLLPLYPAMAAMVALWVDARLRQAGPRWPIGVALAGIGLATAMAIAAGCRMEVCPLASIVGSLGLVLGLGVGVWGLRRGDRSTGAGAAAALAGLIVVLCCVPPLSTWYIRSRDPKPAFLEIARVAGDRDLFLYRPDDRVRGGCGFYRNRTALEVQKPDALVSQLRDHPDARAVLLFNLGNYPELTAEASRLGVKIEVDQEIPKIGLNWPVTLIRIGTKS